MITLIKKSVFSFSQKKSFMITCKEASQLLNLNDVKFIDCRDPNVYAQEHIQGAFNVNEIFTFLSTSDQQGQKVFETIFEDSFQKIGLNNNDLAIVYEDCLKSRFGSSCRGLFILKTLGHENVQIIEGGFKEWKQNNYPSDNKYPQIQSRGNFKVQWNSQNYANKYDMLQAIKNNDTYIIDVRNDDEWLGESSSPYGKDFLPRKGRLPKSIHLNWIQLMKEIDGKTQMIQNQEIQNILSKHGIQKDSQIIVYCFKGARASNSLVALQQAGYINVKNYFSGFNEWARDFKYQIDN